MRADGLIGKVKTCKQCGVATSLVKIPNLGAAEANYAVAVFDMPCLACPNGHERAFAYPEFPAEMLEEIFERLPKVVQKGFVSSGRFCCRCRSSMSQAMPEDGTLELQIALRDLDSFRVELAGVLWRCPSCGQKQVLKDRKLKFEIPEALVKGFKSVNL